MIRVECSAASHAPKVAFVGRIQINPDGTVALGEPFEQDAMLEHRRLFGTSVEGPDWEYRDAHPVTRWRATFECPLCGLTVPVRRETIAPAAAGLRAAGLTSLSLEALAAILS